jgi:two-component system, NtrC family, response regulator AtoC
MTAVLVVEDEAKLRAALTDALAAAGHPTLTAAGVTDARKQIANESIGCVLLDIRLRDGDGLALLQELRGGANRNVPVIMVTAYGDSDRTIQAMRDGAFDYVTKPFDLDRLLAVVDRALEQFQLAREPLPQPASSAADALVGASEAMLAVTKVIGRAAASDAPVLITGETGTGKQLVARAIHRYSSRTAEPFIAVNVAALAPTSIESELFGHEKGAFAGAAARRVGRIELAGAGTLLLDEVADLDPSLQTKLLRVLQDGAFERVGGNELIKSRARIVAATSKIVRPGQTGALRDDLYYRLAVIEIHVPPLRERRSDIPLLVAHALQGGPARAVTEQVMRELMAYDWPGNVRELVHVIARAAVMTSGDVIDAVALPNTIREPARRLGPSIDPSSMTLKEALAAFEREVIVAALERANNNRSEAARQLGLARTHLYAKLEEHGITAPESKKPSGS